MSTASVTQETTERQAPDCRHHWLIASPDGAVSMGRCKVCGESREFHNSLVDSFWERDGSEQGGASWNRSLRGSGSSLPINEGF